MRVIHVAPTAFGTAGVYGGGERYPLELARALSTKVDCTLVTFGSRDHAYRDGSLTTRVVRPVTYLAGNPACPIVPIVPGIGGSDIVHAHHLRSPVSIWSALMARLQGAATAVTDHGLQLRGATGLARRSFDRFLLVSRYSAAELQAPPDRTTVVYGGADTARYHPAGDVRRGVLFVGRITPHKGIDRLIRALPRGASLTVAGSGGHDPRLPERAYPGLLRRLAADKAVTFAGPIPDRSLPELYRRAQVLVLPSVDVTCYGRPIRVSELLGLAVLEAMASGTPVVASRLGGLPEIVQDGVTGILVEPGDVTELHETLSALLADAPLRARLGAAARERVAAELTWDTCADRCLEAYQSAMAVP